MNRPFRLLLVFLLLVLGAASKGHADDSPTVKPGSITQESLRATLTFLASPELEGRETATRGQRLAALYIATRFKQLGLKPVGQDGGYYQHFDLEVLKAGKNSSITIKRKSGETKTYYKLLTDFYFNPRGLKNGALTAPLAFAGYGIVSPESEYDYNDYEDLDPKGKIVLIMGWEPQEKDSTSIFNGTKPTRFSGRRGQQLKVDSAKARGALGVLYVSEVGDHGGLATSMRFLQEIVRKGAMGLFDTSATSQTTIPVFTISKQVANELLQSSGKTINEIHQRIDKKLKPMSFDVKATEVTLSVEVERAVVQSENVLGLLEGSDPVLKDEVIVYTAHYDHEGIGGDGAIYHGADDNASGTTAVLELARAFANSPQRPKRSILFLTFSAEEKGLLGSIYYTNNPVITLNNTISNLNSDMIGRIDPIYETTPDSANFVFVIGAAVLSSDLKAAIEEANRETVNMTLDYRYDDPNDPNQYYRRSDHFNFAKKGIPVAFFTDGTHKDYHRPTDTAEKINYEKLEKIVKLLYVTGWKLANNPTRPVINGNPEMYR